MNCSFAPGTPGRAESATRSHTFSIGPVAKNRLIRMLWEVRAPATIFPFAEHFSVEGGGRLGKLIVFMALITRVYFGTVDCQPFAGRIRAQDQEPKAMAKS